MRTLYFIILLSTYVLYQLDQASSHDPLLILIDPESGTAELPYKATESDGRIIYPEIEPNGRNHMYLCPPGSHETEIYEPPRSQRDLEDNHCLIDYSSKLILQDTPKCPSEVKPLFLKVIDENLISQKKCGTSIAHVLHNFGFNYCKLKTNPLAENPVNSQFLSMYDICLDTGASRPFWTKHQIRTGFMLNDARLIQSQRSEYESHLNTEPFLTKTAKRHKDTFQEQAKEYNTQAPDTPHKMIPQRLVPHEDIAIKVWKKTTAHYLNTAALWEKLVPVMKSINDGIRRTAITVNLKSYHEKTITDDNLDIYTLTYSYLPTLKRILNKLNIIQIPFGWNIWCKFVHYPRENQGIMIFLHNLPDNPPKNMNNYSKDHSQDKPSTKPFGSNNDSNKSAESSKGKETDDSKAEELLKERECQTTVPCNFEKWFANQPEQPFSNDLFDYAYCCKVNKNRVKELFGIELENEIALLNINDIITTDLQSGAEKLKLL